MWIRGAYLACATAASAAVAAQPVELPVIAAPNPILYDVPAFYPRESVEKREEGITVVTFKVTAAGAATGCAVTVSSGHPSLDAAACDLIASAIYPGVPDENQPLREQRVNWRLPAR